MICCINLVFKHRWANLHHSRICESSYWHQWTGRKS